MVNTFSSLSQRQTILSH